ncbi:MAG: glycosyltransferase [Candidatus Kerfeldbacteria bacterium]|nr:glycosyltransferase [Candidatus Kerfeldbacteria bacterium]
MKILHAPFNVAGQPAIIAEAQRALGHTSDVLVFNDNYLHYHYDKNLAVAGRSTIHKTIIYLTNLFAALAHYDVFHFHFGGSLLPWNLDLQLERLLRKKVLMHYWGSDVIQTDIARHYTLWGPELLTKIYPNRNDDLQRKKLNKVKQIVNKTIVGDFSLLAYSPDSMVIRQAFNLSNVPFVGVLSKKNRINIVHAPTHRGIKGTSQINAAMKIICQRYPVDYQLIEHRPHSEAMALYAKADIIVDDLLHGPYGILAIECMALGKPVLARIDKKLVHYYPNLPIVNSNPDTIVDDIIRLITNWDLRKSLGIAGREYVKRHHNAHAIAQQLVDLYKSI